MRPFSVRLADMKSLPTAIVFCVLCCGGCTSTPISPEARRAELPDLMVEATVADPGAYRKADATQSPDTVSKTVKYSGAIGAVGGAIGALAVAGIAAASDANTMAEQQRSFDQSQALFLPALNRFAETAPTDSVGAAVAGAVKGNRFLSSRVKGYSGNALRTAITRFGFVMRNQQQGEEPRMLADIMINVRITLADGTCVMDRNFRSSSSRAYSVAELAQDASLVKRSYEEACTWLKESVSRELMRTYGE